MSLKRFGGWEPRQLTRVTAWTDDGRASAWETRTETEWDGRERSLMLALSLWEAGLCRRCGHHLDETMDPANDQDNPETGHGWTADGPDECFACKALHRAEEKWHKEAPEVAPYSIWSAALVAKRPRMRHR
ncbi:hypothetical protein AB0J14_04725 [Micromonospora arborensis]|uniref:hypothetical protein n=1 Tax=Micromonospora arborensis TaxID=2116518 RepID=UPI0033FF3FD0